MKKAFALFALLSLIPIFADAHNRFERAILARSDVTHFWEMHDAPGAGGTTPGPCPSTAADSIADGATALPSPVPLVQVTGNGATASVTCAMPPIYFGGGTSMGFCNGGGAGGGSCSGTALSANSPWWQIPQSVFPTAPFTVFCVLAPMPIGDGTHDSGIWNYAAGTDILELRYTTNAQPAFYLNSGAHNSSGYVNKSFMVFTVDTAPKESLYINAVPIAQATAAVPTPAATTGQFGNRVTTGNPGFNGTMEDCGYANTAWSLSTIQYLYSIVEANGSF